MVTMTTTKKTALEQLKETAAEIQEAETTLHKLRRHRDVLMSKARREGETWRRIAAESGMTEHGARKALTHAGLIAPPTPKK